MSLVRCEELWGECRILHDSPSISRYYGSIYIPLNLNHGWGIYNLSGHLINDTVDFRGTERSPNNQVTEATINSGHVLNYADDYHYVYVGRINIHYGHFLINTLPRFWAIQRLRTHRTKILCHGHGRPEDWFNFPFFAKICRALGLEPHDFVMFNAPIRLREVEIPCTSFEEQYQAHTEYRNFCRFVGERLHASGDSHNNDRPIYFSKAALTSGVGRIRNEQAFINVIEAAGIDVVAPETLGIEEQIRIFGTRSLILGTAGSYFHTSIFAPSGSRIVVVNPTIHINSNYSLIDALTGNDAAYYYPSDLRVVTPSAEDTFLTTREFADPVAAAEQYLAVLGLI